MTSSNQITEEKCWTWYFDWWQSGSYPYSIYANSYVYKRQANVLFHDASIYLAVIGTSWEKMYCEWYRLHKTSWSLSEDMRPYKKEFQYHTHGDIGLSAGTFSFMNRLFAFRLQGCKQVLLASLKSILSSFCWSRSYINGNFIFVAVVTPPEEPQYATVVQNNNITTSSISQPTITTRPTIVTKLEPNQDIKPIIISMGGTLPTSLEPINLKITPNT